MYSAVIGADRTEIEQITAIRIFETILCIPKRTQWNTMVSKGIKNKVAVRYSITSESRIRA